MITKKWNTAPKCSIIVLKRRAYIYSCYFKLNYQKNLDYKIKQSKKLESTHFSSNEIIKE